MEGSGAFTAVNRKKWIQRIRKSVAVLGVLLCGTGAYCGNALNKLPKTYAAAQEQAFSLADNPLFTVDPQRQQLRLLDAIPVGTVQVRQTRRETVILGGTPFGMKMYTDGALIVGFADVDSKTGSCCPARAGGLRIGDVIRAVNGEKITGNQEASAKISQCGGASVQLTVERGGETKEVNIQPAYSKSSGAYKAGLWIKDSCAGIGTLTYMTEDGTFAGLGHGISDSDTGKLMPLEYGDIVPVTLSGVTKGIKGSPGELKGYFASDESMGVLQANTGCGVFGQLNSTPEGMTAEIAFRQEVYRGKAQIRTTVSGEPRWYDVEIERISYDNAATQNMVIHITDPELLKITGGIVQGMSGSPIIQDGKLVGAVTHVFIGDPTRGYGIFIENMLDAAG